MSKRQPLIRINDHDVALDEICEFIVEAPPEASEAETARAVRLVGGRTIPLAPNEAARVLDFFRQNEE